MALCVAAFVERRLIPVGPAYLAHVRRAVHDLSFEEHDKHLEEQQRRRNLEQEADEEDDLSVGDEKETEDL
jgi:DnaJ homolog subfamily C member 2